MGGIDSNVDLIYQHLLYVYYKTLQWEAAMQCEHFTQICKKFFYKRQIQLFSTEKKKKNNQGQYKLFVPKQKQGGGEYKFILD